MGGGDAWRGGRAGRTWEGRGGAGGMYSQGQGQEGNAGWVEGWEGWAGGMGGGVGTGEVQEGWGERDGRGGHGTGASAQVRCLRRHLLAAAARRRPPSHGPSSVVAVVDLGRWCRQSPAWRSSGGTTGAWLQQLRAKQRSLVAVARQGHWLQQLEAAKRDAAQLSFEQHCAAFVRTANLPVAAAATGWYESKFKRY